LTDKTKVSLAWYYFVLFGVVALSSLSMTWWSMFDLGVHTLSVPVLVAAVVSVIFDIGGMFLVLLSIEYAKTNDSGFWTELGAYAFIGTSAYLVAQHGILLQYPAAGVVMFAAAPIVLGIMLKAMLHYLTRLQRRATGRITEKLPSVGWLTWVRYGRQSWKLMSVAMQGRLVNAADKLEIAADRHGIFGQDKTTQVDAVLGQAETIVETPTRTTPELVQTQDKKPEQLSQPVVRKELTSPDSLSLPIWLPNEPDMKLSTLVRTCLDNGVFDIETMFRYAQDIKGQEVNKMSLSRTLTREKQKAL
jgi:hypothetical protein